MNRFTMRLWSIHPKYLDTRGLTACWREALLARKVLSGGTTAYANHPQLIRFRASTEPVQALDCYLSALWDEADRRGYRFDRSKVGPVGGPAVLPVTTGQLDYEFEHLKKKLQTRDPARLEALLNIGAIEPHPMFCVSEGGIAVWEIIN